MAFEHHQLLPFNSELAEPVYIKETRRLNTVFTDHFLLVTADNGDN